MRILQVVGQLGYGGAEVLVAQFARYCAAAGHETQIATGMVVEPGMRDVQQDAGIKVHEMGGGMLRGYRYLRRLIAGESFDVVHAHLFPALYQVAWLPCDGQHHVYTEHSDANRRRQLPLAVIAERPTYDRFDAVIAVSETTRSALRDFLPGLPVKVIHNGIDYDRFAGATPLPRADLHWDDADIILVAVGAFRTEKNQVALVEALAELPPAYKLLLLGDGPERVLIESRIAALNLVSRVQLVGTTAVPERYLKMADVGVSAALNEGFGLSALEAAAAGLPLAVSDVPGHREVLGDQVAYFPDLSPSAMAATIQTCRERGTVMTSDRVFRLSDTFDATLDLYGSLCRGAES